MNLIEQLGGYEKAKSIFLSNEDDFSFYSVEHQYYSDKPIHRDSINIENLEENLLQYRRENNIFEVGDLVVIKASPFWPEDYVIHTVEQEHIGKWYMLAWRHATPEEIEAGRRL